MTNRFKLTAGLLTLSALALVQLALQPSLLKLGLGPAPLQAQGAGSSSTDADKNETDSLAADDKTDSSSAPSPGELPNSLSNSFQNSQNNGGGAENTVNRLMSHGLTTYQIYDSTLNMPAAAYSLPADWRATSQVSWNIEHFSQPSHMYSIAVSPDGLSAVEFLPAEQFCWLVPNPGFKHPGQEMGDGSTLLPPVSAVDAMVHFEIPKLRGKVEGLQIVQVQAMPELGQLLNSPAPQGASQEGVWAKLCYQINGQPIEEEIYGLKVAFSGLPSYGAAGKLMQYNWGFARLFSFRAPAGQLEASRPVFAAMIKSGQPNPAWLAAKQQIQQKALQHNNFRLLLTKQSIDNANMLSRTVIAGSEDFFRHQAERREYEGVSDRLRFQARHGYSPPSAGISSTGNSSSGYTRTDAVNDLLGGQETYEDGSTHTGYHNYMWSDGQGNYSPSNDPNFNPNINSDRTWTLLQKKQIGQ